MATSGAQEYQARSESPPSPSQLPPVPNSPVYSVASTAQGAGGVGVRIGDGGSQFSLPAPPIPRPAHAVLAKADLERSQEAYGDLVASAKSYRLALASLSSSASAFAAALEACARLKEARADLIGPISTSNSSSTSSASSSSSSSSAAAAAVVATASSTVTTSSSNHRGCTADPLLSTSGVHHLIANHQQILSDTVYRSFEVPLLHDLDRWRCIIEDEEATYQHRITAQSREVKRLEREGLKLHRQRRRDIGRFRAHLVDLTAKLDGLTTLHADHARSLLRESQETSTRIVDASCSLVRAEVDIFESLARKGWSGGGLDDLLDRGRDLFAADDDAIAHHPAPDPAKLFSILPPKSILADSSDSCLLPATNTYSSSNEDDEYPSSSSTTSSSSSSSSEASTSTITAAATTITTTETNRPRNSNNNNPRPFSPQPIRRIPTDVTFDSLAALAAPVATTTAPSRRRADTDDDDDDDDDVRGRALSHRLVGSVEEETGAADK